MNFTAITENAQVLSFIFTTLQKSKYVLYGVETLVALALLMVVVFFLKRVFSITHVIISLVLGLILKVLETVTGIALLVTISYFLDYAPAVDLVHHIVASIKSANGMGMVADFISHKWKDLILPAIPIK
jgi:hypothetical protein